MQHDNILKKAKFWPLSYPLHPTMGSNPGIRTKVEFVLLYIYCTSACMRNLGKVLTTDLVIAKFKYLSFDTA